MAGITKANRRRALENQVNRLDRRLTQMRRSSDLYGWARLLAFLAALALSVLAYFLVGDWLFWLILIPWLAAFAFFVSIHRRVESAILRHQAWRDMKSHHLARMELDWDTIPDRRPAQPEHSLELDLDLVGKHSLYRLLDTAVTNEGSQRLRAWLSSPVPDVARTHERQALVRELARLTPLRDRLHVEARVAVGTDSQWSASRFQQWLAAPSAPSLLVPALLLSALAATTLLLFILYRIGLLPPLWLFSLFLYAALLLIASRGIGDTFHEALDLQDGLKQLSAVAGVLERHDYRHAPHLRALCAPFLEGGQQVSHYLRRTERLLALIGLGQNPYLGSALNLILPWNLYCAYWLGQYKKVLAPHLVVWLDRWFELEALSALATFAYLNPTYTFPQVVQSEDTSLPVFRATQLGHPLLPHDARVCNDFTLDALGEIGILTGSNMAGKSSFLRTVAVNLALAYAGGPVVADALHTAPFRLATCIRVSDSVTEGLSYFYAEVQCLKTLLSDLETPHPLPLFFFIDEIFRGTNNRERLIGSRAFIRALVGKHGVGLISTHDLELVHLADESPQIHNYHFREEVIGDRMVFDYTLRSGPSPTTNALKIMQLAGLPIATLEDAKQHINSGRKQG
ncbi:MAG TPA: hypothetical protein VF707_06495 [Ardenticatenaceae bacterium]